jgi:2-polyprenyl-3-methyl-5-hydroxy-6-metoxy-1,4-benzoquinol methylase
MMELSEEARLQRAQTFDQIAGLYDRGRREPPGWLYDAVFAGSRMDIETARVLEIGCGTGKSTLPMARRGASILALEMGAKPGAPGATSSCEFSEGRSAMHTI